MLLSGAVTRPTLPLVKRAFEAMPGPKLVFGIGSCAVGGGCWFDTYNVTGGGATAVPVNYYIPGCPPRPEAIIYGVALALGLVDKKAAPVELKQVEFPIDVYERNKAWEERNVIYEVLNRMSQEDPDRRRRPGPRRQPGPGPEGRTATTSRPRTAGRTA